MPTSYFCRSIWVELTGILIIILLIEIDVLANPQAYLNKRSPTICKTKECKMMNENLRSKANLAANPCEDFYEFTCGKYTQEKAEVERINTNINKQLIDIAKIPLLRNDHRALKMTKEMFHRCLQHESHIEDLRKMIARLGGWALLDLNWNKKDFSLGKFFSKSIEIGYLPDSLFTIDIQILPETRINTISIKKKGSSHSVIEKFLLTPQLFESALNDSSRIQKPDYLRNKFIPNFSKKLKVDIKRLKNEYKEYWKIRKLLIDINQEPAQFTQVKISDLMVSYNNIPWIEIFTSVFKPISIDANDVIIIQCPRCLKLLNELLHNISTESLASYLMGSFAFYAIFHADSEMMKEWLESNTDWSLEQYCSNIIFSLFRRVMDYEYINREYFDRSLTPKVSNFIGKLKSAMINTIRVSPMMNSEDSDTTTRDTAIAKIQEMVFKIAYDDEIIKGQQVLQYYDKLNLVNNSYFFSFFHIKQFVRGKRLENLKKPAKLPYLEATCGNAAYYAYHNTFFLSLSVLSASLFSKGNRPEYLNFGRLGVIIAHEMHHAFDHENYVFDKLGVARSWWNPEARKKHMATMECIATQYSDFINLETGNKVNGLKTLAENFAENGGIEIAYKAYHDLPKGGELLLQDFSNFTFVQMFWMNYGATLCAKLSKETILKRETTSTHSIERVRVNGAAINSKEFAIDWRCKENTPMNQKKKCPIWK